MCYLAQCSHTHTRVPERSKIAELTEAMVTPCFWIAEPALWAERISVGSTAATRTCGLIPPAAEGVQMALGGHNVPRMVTRGYPAASHESLARPARGGGGEWPSDLFSVPGTGFVEFVGSMRLGAKPVQGAITFATLPDRSRGWSRSELALLRQGLLDGGVCRR